MTLLPGSIAVVLALAVAALLFPSFVAAEHRRHGALRANVALRRFAALLYAIGLACYVLLPVADGCFPAQLHPLAGLSSPGALAQFACNVALFIPMGALTRRGWPATVAIGLATSTLIEFTQLTGLWFSFDCAYRVFDVNDIIANTLGAALGCTVTHLLPPPRTEPADSQLRRRLLGMSCDGFLLCWLAVACGGSWWLSALIVLITTLPTGTTLGQRLVLLRTRSPDPASVAIRWVLGSGGLGLTLAATEHLGWPAVALALLWCGAHAVGVSCDRDRRGITGRTSGLELLDVRAPASVRTS